MRMLLIIVAVSVFASCDAAFGQNSEKVTYDDHVKPVLRESCFKCHNQNEDKGGLALDTYARLMEGGSSGEVVYAAELDNSRLWHLVNHEDEPAMPPNSPKLAAAKLAVIKKWIDGGALENSGSKAV
ncbi:MAG: hypothetical protein NXI22_26565, partial [bacterium]|nr:hypothetical protein [bacterium]